MKIKTIERKSQKKKKTYLEKEETIQRTVTITKDKAKQQTVNKQSTNDKRNKNKLLNKREERKIQSNDDNTHWTLQSLRVTKRRLPINTYVDT